ncbi:hypothetical protein AB205_0132210 [Aquarana catesbeiana]|uniref:Uncharacterized protein n=1 Tax=Aquarana catesbeiana TaxID=8400 RepID=A0A2G9NCE6_AQUCT|nr:hypothetical protein AB205_0132210 [Aquarana catesbeiana]
MGGYSMMSVWAVVFMVALSQQEKVSWMPYLSMVCIFAYILSFGIGPGIYRAINVDVNLQLSLKKNSSLSTMTLIYFQIYKASSVFTFSYFMNRQYIFWCV